MRSPLSMSSAGPINKLTIPPFYEPIDTVCGGSGSLTSEEEIHLRILRARLHYDRYCFPVHLSIIDHEDCSRSLPWIWKKAFDSMLYVLCMNMGLLALLVFSFRCADVDVLYCIGKACPMSWVLLVSMFAFFLLRWLYCCVRDKVVIRIEGTHGGWMFSVVGEIDDMFKNQRFNDSRVLGYS
jgi:hypothetical protein